jgi:uncharacterized protein
MTDDQPEIIRDEQAGRFVLAESPDAAYLDITETDGRLILRHTEVDRVLEGRGIGGELVRAALDHAEEAELTVVPRCRFAAAWLARHPERAREVDVESA